MASITCSCKVVLFSSLAPSAVVSVWWSLPALFLRAMSMTCEHLASATCSRLYFPTIHR